MKTEFDVTEINMFAIEHEARRLRAEQTRLMIKAVSAWFSRKNGAYVEPQGGRTA